MTGEEIKELFESLIDDSIDETTFYTLLNTVKDDLEENRDWMYLKAVDTSETLTASNTYTTSRSLPSDFRQILNIVIDEISYRGIPFEMREQHKDGQSRYYLDYANDNYYIIGTAESKTINFFYVKTTDDIEATTSPVFPARFHKVLAFDVAQLYMEGIDADSQYNAMNPAHKVMRARIFNSMVKWDMKLKMAEMDYSATPILNSGTQPDKIDIYD